MIGLVECPYCQAPHKVQDDVTDPMETYEEECEHCGKIFFVNVDWHPVFRVREIPDFNHCLHHWSRPFYDGVLGKLCRMCNICYKIETLDE